MSYLPPVGWADVATKQDLKLLSTELRTEIEKVRSDLGERINSLQSAMHDDSRSQLRWMVGAVLTIQVASISTFAVIVNWMV